MKTQLTRFYWLDILRGLAALSVVLWHWQHFFFDGSWSDMMGKTIYRNHYPLYNLLRPFYGQGWRAVEFFFTLSGFIFFWLYAEKIRKNKLTFNHYLILRISRLFPLHILTLIVVIIEQYWLRKIGRPYFVYNDFSLITFFYNLTLTSNWFSTNNSFNGPSWSVSVEFILYIIYFLFCILQLKKWWQPIVFITFGWFIRGTNFDLVGAGLMSFFSGGIAFYIFQFLNQRLKSKAELLSTLCILPVVLFGAILTRYVFRMELPLYFFEIVLFPLIIVSIALGEISFGSGPGRYFSFLGDISYSSYLWHFPLQVAFVIGVNYLGWNRAVFYSPYTLLFFYAILVSISIVSYNYFELPMQQLIRNKWSDKKYISVDKPTILH